MNFKNTKKILAMTLLSSTLVLTIPTNPVKAANSISTQAQTGLKVSLSGHSWGTGYTVDATLNNTSGKRIEDWKLTLPASSVAINSIWCAKATKNKDSLTISPLEYNKSITSKGSASFGFIGNGKYPSNVKPKLSYKINGKWYSDQNTSASIVDDNKNDKNKVDNKKPENQKPNNQTPSNQKPSNSNSQNNKQPTTSNANDKQAKFGKAVHSGDATFYGAGPGGCCNLDDYENLYYTVAMNRPDYNAYNLAGAYLEVTDKDGDKIKVLVTNELPEGKSGDLDLSTAAFKAIEPLQTGRMKCTWKIIPFPTKKPISYKFKPSSTKYWAEVQIREQRYPLKSVEYKNSKGEWVALERKPYNYYCAPQGMGSSGPYTFRITDMYGHVLIDENIPLNTTEKVIPGKANFPY